MVTISVAPNVDYTVMSLAIPYLEYLEDTLWWNPTTE